MRLLFLFSLSLLAPGSPIFSQHAATLHPNDLVVPADKMQDFADYEVVTLGIDELLQARPTGLGTDLSFRLETSSGTLPFRLAALDLRGPRHQLKSVGAGKQSLLLPRGKTAQFRGKLETVDGKTALFTLDDNFVLGTWKQGETVYHLEPLWRLWDEAPRDAYLVYTDADLIEQADFCGTDDLDGLVPDHSDHNNRMMGGCFEVEIALAADFEMFELFDDAASLENFMLNTLASAQTNFDDEFDDELFFIVVETVIATTNAQDPWTNSTDGANDLLPDFADWGNNGNFSVPFDVASLWTGRDLDGPSIGWAYVRGLCTNGRYNILELFSSNTAFLRVLWAHELGHNFGSNHDSDNGNIMAASVNSATTWSNQSLNAINSYYQSLNCLSSCPNPDPPVAVASTFFSEVCDGSVVTFFDESTGDVDSRNWQFPGAFPSTSTAAGPSVTYPGPGLYTATLNVSNGFGSDQTQLTVRVSPLASEGATVLFSETFDDDIAGYSIFNPDGQNTWEIVEVEGNAGDFAAVVNNYDNNLPGQLDQLVMPDLDFTGISNPTLIVEYAYRRYSTALEDQLRIKVNTPSGSQILFTGDEDGSGNFATGDDLADRFFPKNFDDWCLAGPACIELDLSAFSNETTVQIVVENVNGYGNYMYVDNILVFGNCQAALPVEWLNFTAQVVDKTTAGLTWSVNQDAANQGFMVQRSNSANPGEWDDLGWVAADPNQTTNAVYNFVDQSPAPGSTYNYRLRQEDADGLTYFSPIRSLSFGELTTTTVQPNPTTGDLRLLTNSDARAYTLHDASGRVVLSGMVSDKRAELNLSSLPRSVYVLRVGEEVLRVVKQ